MAPLNAPRIPTTKNGWFGPEEHVACAVWPWPWHARCGRREQYISATAIHKLPDKPHLPRFSLHHPVLPSQHHSPLRTFSSARVLISIALFCCAGRWVWPCLLSHHTHELRAVGVRTPDSSCMAFGQSTQAMPKLREAEPLPHVP
jgi:hypothetical protein